MKKVFVQDVEDAPDPDSNSTNTRGSRDVSRASRGSRDVDPDDVEAPPDANIAIEAGSIGSSERDDRASSAVSFSSARRTTFALPEDKLIEVMRESETTYYLLGCLPATPATLATTCALCLVSLLPYASLL